MILFGKLTLLLFDLALNNIIIVVSLVFIVFSLRNRFKKVNNEDQRDLLNSKINKKGRSSQTSNKNQANDAEIIIIGSGILGSVMSANLGKDGYRITVIERDFKQPSRIVGELMQPGGVEALKTLGLGSALEGIDAQVSHGYKIYNNELGTTIDLPYGSDRRTSESAPDHGTATQLTAITGKAFHHGRLVQNLRRASDPYTNVSKIEGDALKLIKDGSVVIGVEYRDNTTQEIKPVYAPLTIVADGCFSKFRKHLLPPGTMPQVKSYFVGILIRNTHDIDTEAGTEVGLGTNCGDRPYFAEVILANPSVILVYRISSFHTRVLIDVPSPLPSNLREYLTSVIVPQLPDQYTAAFEEALLETFTRRRSDNQTDDHLAATFKVMPNSYLCTSQPNVPGVITLGDAFNMRHPLTGGGMTVALNDAIFWGRELNRILESTAATSAPVTGDQSGKVSRELDISRKRFARSRSMGYSFAVNVLAQALYALFASGNDMYLKELREACFHYFQMGGTCISGPMGIISITNAKPHILIGHFFAVAFYAIYRSTFVKRRRIYQWFNLYTSIPFSFGLLSKACRIIAPLVWNEVKSTDIRFFNH